MKFLQVAQRCVSDGLSHQQLNRLQIVKTLSTNSIFGSGNDNQNTNSSEFSDDFERRIFSRHLNDDSSSFIRRLDRNENRNGHFNDDSSSFFRRLDRIENRNGAGMYSNFRGGDKANILEGGDESVSTLADGLEKRLKSAATYFEVNEKEIEQDDYTFRPDMNVRNGMTYTPEDLNLRKPAVWRPGKRTEFEVTTEEVLRKADFRNVRFLANFLTDAGIIIKRSKTGISAKAQRKVAREIKIARAFGLLPFTTMGTKAFVFGRTMKDHDSDFELDNYGNRGDAGNFHNPVGV